MSQTESDQQQPTPEQEQQPELEKNTDDKKEIADEEREKMLNAENNTKNSDKKESTEHDNNTDEAPRTKPKRKLPINAIKIPGFCSSKNKETPKEDESKAAEIDTSAAAAKDAESAAGENKGTPTKENKKGFLEAIRLPLSTVFNRKRTKETDAELGGTGGVGLASIETLEEDKEKNVEDGMETVRLDIDANDGDPPKQHPFFVALNQAKRNPLISGVVAFVILITLVLLGIALLGPRRQVEFRLIDGKYAEAQTSCGLVQGEYDLENGRAFVFRGIPYAVPPVGENRWKPSKPRNTIEECWNGTYIAHNYTVKCWQRELVKDGPFKVTGQEDCLYLDIFTPKIVTDSPLAVVVLIGAETLSGGSPGVMEPTAELSRINDIVYVRPNFRMDIFGFLAVEAITRASRPQVSGNYALSDIINVLDWVQLNIEHFGGDKNKVTLWGHRAGGTLVTALMLSNEAKGKFARAWISSGSSLFPSRELEASQKINEQFMENIKCSDLTCLNNKTADDLMKAVPDSWHSKELGLPEVKEQEAIDNKHEWLVKDGKYLKDDIGEVIKNPLPVKVVMGTSAQSGVPSSILSQNLTEVEVQKIIKGSLIGHLNLTEEALKRYNSTAEGLATMISDIRVVCPLLVLANRNEKKEIPFYVSTFPESSLAGVDNDAKAILGIFPNETPQQRRHLQAMQNLFKYFVHHGEVKEIEQSKKVLIVHEDPEAKTDYDNCNLWIKNYDIVPKYGRVD